MKAMVKGVALSGAGALLLGASLALSSAGAASGANAIGGSHLGQPDTSCISSTYCVVDSNTGTGGALKGTSGAKGKGIAAILGVGNGFNSFGVEGKSNGSGGTGVEGYSVTGANGGTGVAGVGGFIGVSAYNPSCCNTFSYGFTSQVDDYSSYPIYTFGAAEGTSIPAGSFIVDAAGNGVFDGSVTAFGGYYTAIKLGSGKVRAATPLAPRATIEDTGTARLNDGVGVVHLGRDFASVLDTSKGYQVFITPDGDTRGWLYVATKYQGGFIVREAEHGRSSVEFDYRVVGHLAGTPEERFPAYNLRRLHRPHLPAYTQPAP